MNLGFDLNVWNNTKAIESGEFESLKLGGHKITILDASLYKSEISGNTSLKVCVDIAEGDEQAFYFQKQYNENPNSDKKWSNGATKYLSLKEENLGYTKGFISSLEKSNPNFKFDTSKGWEQLKNLKCAGVFGLEEYQDQDGEIKTATKLIQFRSIDKLEDIKIPKVKLITGDYVSYDDYQAKKQQKNVDSSENTVIISKDELPF